MSLFLWAFALGITYVTLWLVWTMPVRIPVLMVYMMFWAIAVPFMGTLQITGPRELYFQMYWLIEAIGYMLCSLVGLSLLKTIIKDPRWLVDLQAIACIVVALPFISCLWELSWHPWLAVAKWCDLAIICLVAYGLFHVEHWEPVNEGLAWGLAMGMSGHVICALIQKDQNPVEWLRWLYQLAGILQLSMWAYSLSRPKPPQIVELLAI